MRSFTDGDKANDTIDAAREKVAHVVINGDTQFGRHRPATARPIEPPAKILADPRTRKAYDSSLTAARQAYLSANDPTHGATHLNMRTSAGPSRFRPVGPRVHECTRRTH